MTTRDIKIKVTGVQSVAGADDEPEVLELETRGTYSEKTETAISNMTNSLKMWKNR